MWDWIKSLAEIRGTGEPAVLVTVTGCQGSTPRNIGAKMLVMEAGFLGTVGGGQLEGLALEEAKNCLESGDNLEITYPLASKAGQCCGGNVKLFFESINKGPILYIFGAGHVGRALCQTLVDTPFSVHVIDPRDQWISSPKLPPSVTKHLCEWDVFVEKAHWDAKRTYTVVMTHSHGIDQSLISYLLRRPHRYLGLIGSQAKWERFRQRLKNRNFSDDELSRVHCPVGIPLGGKSPKEVAISISAQILKVHHAVN